jgi:16S rRNA processing protein RimM
MLDYLVVGQIGRPHGVRGEMRMRIFSDFPERLVRGTQVYVGEGYIPLQIHSSRWEGDAMLIAFDGYRNRTQAETLCNLWVYVRADERPPLEEGEYYHHQLIGLRAITDDEDPALQMLGIITDILRTGANDVYVIQKEDKEVLLPALNETILEVNLARGEMRVHLLPRLLNG